MNGTRKLMDTVLGISIAVNGYFLRGALSSLEKIEERTRATEVGLAVERTTNAIQSNQIAAMYRDSFRRKN